MQRLRFSIYFKGIAILLDLIVLAAVFLFFFIIQNRDLQVKNVDWEQNIFSIVLLSLFWVLLGGRSKLYSIPRNLTYTLYLERFITHMVIFLFGIILLGKVSNNIFIKQERLTLALILFLSLFIIKSSIFFILKHIRTLGLNFRNVMFLGNTSNSKEILKNTFKKRKDYGFKIFEFPESEVSVENLKMFWIENGIHSLYFSSENSGFSKDLEERIFHEAEKHKVRIVLVPSIIQNNFFEYDLGYIETQPILTPKKFPLDFFSNYILKRIFDILFSLLILILVCSWLFPIIALLIKLNSKGPVFFIQKRYGFHDEVFNCFKFRTMFVNEDHATKTTTENDHRITSLGKFLRKSSMDELPQFLNVLFGNMSVVGPRPHMLLVDDFYKSKIERYSLRSKVKPGITGLAQVNGLRGDEEDMSIAMQKRILADSFYVRNWSAVLDLVIILKTVFLLISGDKNAR